VVRDGQNLAKKRGKRRTIALSMSALFNGANCSCSGAPAAAMELLRVAESRNEMVLAYP
jgi:hypothetical protein